MIGLWREVRERGGARSPAANSRARVTRVAKRRHKALLVVSDKPGNKLRGQMLLAPTIEPPRRIVAPRRPSPPLSALRYPIFGFRAGSLSRARADRVHRENAIP